MIMMIKLSQQDGNDDENNGWKQRLTMIVSASRSATAVKVHLQGWEAKKQAIGVITYLLTDYAPFPAMPKLIE